MLSISVIARLLHPSYFFSTRLSWRRVILPSSFPLTTTTTMITTDNISLWTKHSPWNCTWVRSQNKSENSTFHGFCETNAYWTLEPGIFSSDISFSFIFISVCCLLLRCVCVCVSVCCFGTKVERFSLSIVCITMIFLGIQCVFLCVLTYYILLVLSHSSSFFVLSPLFLALGSSVPLCVHRQT